MKFKLVESIDWNNVQYGVHQFSTESIIFRGTEEECIKYIDERPELWDDAQVYFMTPDDPHYLKEGIYSYQTWVRPMKGEKQPSKILTYGSDVILTRSPYSKEVFGRDWKRHIAKIIDWCKENNPGLIRLTHDFRSSNFDDPNSNEAFIAAIEDKISRGEYLLLPSLTEDMKYYPQDYDTIDLEYEKLDLEDKIIDWTYEVDKEDLYTFIFESCLTEEDFPTAFEDTFEPMYEEDWDSFVTWLEDNFDKIFSKYEDKILDHFRNKAVEDAEMNYNPDDDIDPDTMPGGHDDYRFDEAINEGEDMKFKLVEAAESKICCICKKPFDGYGNNAEPVCSGSCCDECNMKEVIPARMKMLDKPSTEDIDEAVINEGNSVSGKIPPALDSFLQDIAQMYQTIDYGDIMDHDYTENDIRKLNNLRRSFITWAQYDEDDEEVKAKFNQIANKVAEILKRVDEGSLDTLNTEKDDNKMNEVFGDIVNYESAEDWIERIESQEGQISIFDDEDKDTFEKFARDVYFYAKNNGFKRVYVEDDFIQFKKTSTIPEGELATSIDIFGNTHGIYLSAQIYGSDGFLIGEKIRSIHNIAELKSGVNEIKDEAIKNIKEREIKHQKKQEEEQEIAQKYAASSPADDFGDEVVEKLDEEVISDHILIGFNHFDPEDLIIIHGSKEDLETINDDRVEYSEIIPATDKLLWIENDDEYIRVSNTNFNSIDEFRNAVEAEMQKNINAGNDEFEILDLTSFYIDEDSQGLSAQELTDKFMDWIDESYVDNDSNSAIYLIKGNELDDQLISYSSVDEFLESSEDEDFDDDTDFDIDESHETRLMDSLYEGSDDFDDHDDEEDEIDYLYHDASEEELRKMGAFDNLNDEEDERWDNDIIADAYDDEIDDEI